MSSILANGGACMQIATNQADLFVVYGGKITPYNVKIVIDRGIHDIIKPQWVTDSIAMGRRAPFDKKYFFHATASRALADEYQDGTEEDEEDEQDTDTGPDPTRPDAIKDVESPVEEDDREAFEVAPKSKEMKMAPGLAQWLADDEAEEVMSDSAGQHPSDSETENDSDNDDVAGEQDVNEEDLDDWFAKKGDGEEHLDVPAKEHGNMGEDDSAMEYDQDQIFKHLCFYLDSPDNARRHGMNVKTKETNQINQSFDDLKKVITTNGGRVVDLNEGKLTHVVIDKRDASRRVELMKRTSEPKRRRIVISEYIAACIDEGTLLDEDDFVP
ncbi:DNA ligase (ATP) [Marasmius tenuissimus]|nr:DNA ligase (ATP) [Marasmius tenuissimus]